MSTDKTPKHIIKIIKRGFSPVSNTNKREPVKLINKSNGRPKPIISKAGYTATKRLFRNGGKTN